MQRRTSGTSCSGFLRLALTLGGVVGIEFRVLGPLLVLRNGVEVQPRSAKQRLVLAVLLVHANEVVPVGALVEALWGDEPPATATAVVQTYISQLRKVVEPDPGSGRPRVLVTAEPGYRLSLGVQELDATRFEALVAEARVARRAGRVGEAAELLGEALGLWRGAALADVADEEAVRTEALRLDELRVVAVEERVDADMALGRHGELIGELGALVAAHPLRERLWGQLMTCLYRVGRQADALGAYQQVRRRLGEDLGLDPSAELAQLERDILGHATNLDWQPVDDRSREGSRAPIVTPPQEATTGVCFPAALAAERRSPLVGRTDARRVLSEGIASTGEERRAVLVSGEPGIGKTRLVAEVASAAHDAGATVVFGRCAEELIAPFAPWTEVLATLVDQADDALLTSPIERSGGVLARLVPALSRRFAELSVPPPADPATERRRLANAIDDLIGSVASQPPLLIVLDDLHWADEASLAVLSHVLRQGARSGLGIVGTYRDTELGRRHPLAATLAGLRRLPHVNRLSLSGLGHDELGELIASLAGQRVDDEFVTAVEAETEGNPFFVKEILRHLAETGAYEQRDGRWAATRPLSEMGLPEGVREVVGRRLSLLSDSANEVLSVAAVIGAEFDVAILRAVVDSNLDVPEAVGEAVRAGVLREVPGPPGALRVLPCPHPTDPSHRTVRRSPGPHALAHR